MKNVPYARLVGSLMYAQICTKPDISFVVNMLSRFQSNADHEHWMKKTKDHMLVYRKIDEQELEMEAYIDASYKSYMDDLKSDMDTF